MAERVRRVGVLAVAMLAGAGLVRISSSSALAVSSTSHILKSKVPLQAQPTPNPVPEPIVGTAVSGSAVSVVRVPQVRSPALPDHAPPGVWVISIAAAGDGGAAVVSRRAALSRRASGEWVVALTVAIGRTRPRAVLTNAATVGDLVAALRVRVMASDRVIPMPASGLQQGERVRVVRIRRATETVTEAVPFPTITQYSKSMVAGLSAVRRSGSAGRQVRVYRVTYRNGKVVTRVLMSSRLLLAPVPQVVVEGTPAPGSHVQVGRATWYACAGMHAAHLSIPFGTAVTVTDLDNGRTIVVVINDRGPFAPGTDKIVDLCSPAFSALAPLSQGTARVRISW